MAALKTDYDAIVIGAGHNGLTAAAVLAKQGHSVLVLEKTNWNGGMAASKELFKGYKHSVGAWALLIFREKMMELLELDKYGLELIRPPSSYTVFGAPEDACFTHFADDAKMATELVANHGVDAVQGLAGLAEYLQPFKDLVDREIFKAPGSIDRLIAEEPDVKTRELLTRLHTASAMELLREFFPDPEKHRTILGSLVASAIDGTHKGPFTPGTAYSVAYHYCMGDTYEMKVPKGGIGALSDALEKSFEDHGGKVRYKAAVKRFLVEDGKVSGVELRDGETITAKAVLSSLDAQATFLRLAGEENLPNEFVHAVKDIEYTNGYLQIHMTLNELPEFTGHLAFANEDNIGWVMAYIPSAEHLARCWESYRNGEVPEDPATYCYFPSVMDSSLAPEGKYTCTIFCHYFPADIPAGKHNEYKELMAERAIEAIARHAPNFRGAIQDKVIFTHEYFEKTFGITKGDFCHGLIHPEQMWDRRPVAGWSNYHTPLENLYLCGAACHPGPGVTCLPGYNSAQELLRIWED